jgi:hypothetical protein
MSRVFDRRLDVDLARELSEAGAEDDRASALRETRANASPRARPRRARGRADATAVLVTASPSFLDERSHPRGVRARVRTVAGFAGAARPRASRTAGARSSGESAQVRAARTLERRELISMRRISDARLSTIRSRRRAPRG